jgi:tRNA (mo5U34)-methyltransferase
VTLHSGLLATRQMPKRTRNSLEDLFSVDRTVHPSRVHRSSSPDHDPRQAWRSAAESHGLLEPELLLPRIVQPCPLDLPPFMRDTGTWRDMDAKELRSTISALHPWDFFYQLGHGVVTMNWPAVRERMFFRSHVITDVVEKLLGDEIGSCSVLDLACNAGYFALDIASRGLQYAHGIELREKSVHQAQFLMDYYRIENVGFEVADVFAYDPDRPYDVVLNLGLFYHVTQPFELARRTFDLCTRFAVFDTICHREPFPGYIVVGGRDVDRPTNGKYSLELVPTYRGLIETLYEAGFSALVEVIGVADHQINFYDDRVRRTIVAFKQPLEA